MINPRQQDTQKELSIQRAICLKNSIVDYMEAQKEIETGMKAASWIQANKEQILAYFEASQEDWDNYKWQMKHRISKVEDLECLLDLNELEKEVLRKISSQLRWAISPYYLSLIDFDHFHSSPIFKQAVPSILELSDATGYPDPMGEATTNPAPRITRRYPDRLIINVTNQCGMYCRHCQRRRNFGEIDRHASMADLREAINYIRKNPEIRDVLITGGDALLLNNRTIDWLLSELDLIEHVEIKRLGTRVPVTLPQRITKELCAVLKKHPPIYINTQFNSPMEVTPEAKEACDRLIEAGVVLGNQAVLLKGINDDPHVMKKLNQELLRIRVRPYYIFHAKQVQGTAHFITSVQTGLEIMEHLRGYTSGLAVPTYIINAPDGYGKTPILPNYLLALDDEQVTIRTWQNEVFNYPNIC